MVNARSRPRAPPNQSESNWLLFAAMVEAALWEFTGSCEMKPIEYAVQRHMEWYKATALTATARSFTGITTTASSSNRCCLMCCEFAPPRPTRSANFIPKSSPERSATPKCRSA